MYITIILVVIVCLIVTGAAFLLFQTPTPTPTPTSRIEDREDRLTCLSIDCPTLPPVN